MPYTVSTKRIYDPSDRADGTRVLVDGVWPRGLRQADATIDHWYKVIAPSKQLRQWFGHDPERWTDFREAYRCELADKPQPLRELMGLCRDGPVTLLFSARDRQHNQAVVLQEVLLQELGEEQVANEASSPVCYERGGN